MVESAESESLSASLPQAPARACQSLSPSALPSCPPSVHHTFQHSSASLSSMPPLQRAMTTPQLTSSTTETGTAEFAEAISARFSRSGTTALIALDAPPAMISLPTSHPSHTRSSSHSMSTCNPSPSPAPPSVFQATLPDSLSHVLDDPNALVLDIRPHNTYAIARLPHALSLSVPSTLLKRPNFSLARLTQMLPSSADRTRFAQWESASQVLVYDADSSVLADGSNLLGLLRKFRNEGFPEDRKLTWLKGGFHTIWRDHPSLVDQSPPPHDDEEEDVSTPMAKTMSAPAGIDGVLRTKHLPMSAFTMNSTTSLHTSSPSLMRSMHSHSQSELPQANLIPPTPTAPRADPFSAVPTSSHSQSPFSLRLPPAMARSITRLPEVTEGKVVDSSASAPAHGKQAFPRFSTQSSLPSPLPQPSMYGSSSRPLHHSMPHGQQMAFNPFFDTIRQNLELSRGASSHEGSGSKIPLKLPRRVRQRVGELPFEWLRQIARKSGKVHVKPLLETSSESSEEESASEDEDPSPSSSPESTTSSTNSSAEDLTRALAMQFYRIELGEQRRLMGVMDHHSKESGVVNANSMASTGRSVSMIEQSSSIPAARSLSHTGVPSSIPSKPIGKKKKSDQSGQSFPFSITAGVEKGTKNRYRYIWPFEHARVRLLRKNSDDDDYMNASYVQPLGTTKRYIATQGPLAATFNDFWTLCWEQNVHVIVMLTREFESATEKCGTYWTEGSYGPLKLKVIESNDTPERAQKRRDSELSSGFFNVPATASKPSKGKRKRRKRVDGELSSEDSDNLHTIRRVFELRHTGFPMASPRIITQLQYLDWPDMNVPDDPKGLLDLMQEVDGIVETSRKNGAKVWGEGPLRKPSGPSIPINTSTAAATLPDREGSTGEKSDASASAHSPHSPTSTSEDEVDKRTGVAKHTITNPPVLLHCSAGVGRTGGFIAVDAVLDGIRREMRKRREASTNQPLSSSESRASSRAAEERMEVDSHSSEKTSPSPPPRESEGGQEVRDRSSSEEAHALGLGEPSGLTMPLSAGVNEVHVPVAGFRSPPPEAMNVDDGNSNTSPQRPAANRNATIKPSPQLVNEVHNLLKKTNVTGLDAGASSTLPPAQYFSSRGSETSIDDIRARRSMSISTTASAALGSSSVSHSHAGSGGSGGSGHLSVSPISSHGGSSTSLTQAMKSVGVSSAPPPSEGKSKHSSSTEKAKSEEAKFATPALPTSPTSRKHLAMRPSTSSRLNTWRSEVRTETQAAAAEEAHAYSPHRRPVPGRSSSDEKERSASASASASASDSQNENENNNAVSKNKSQQHTHTQRSLTFDYTQPRPLHDDSSPPLLSTYDEPIRRVIEDMREQRMSLCQSLRQYVFVHRAIIEGALMIVDEEKARKARVQAEAELFGSQDLPSSGQTAESRDTKQSFPEGIAPLETETPKTPQHDITMESPLFPTTPPSSSKKPRQWSASEMADIVMQSPLPSPGRQKRGPSPTELTKETAKGEVMLMKRPSVKRKGRSSDEGSQELRYVGDPMVP